VWRVYEWTIRGLHLHCLCVWLGALERKGGMSLMAALLRDIEIPLLDWHSMGWVVLF
jgi:hypothetical protein